MGILSRLRTVVRANVNELISRAEDPKKMLDQITADLSEKLSQAKKEVAAAIADEKQLQRQYETYSRQAGSWEGKAELAVSKGEEALAVEALKRQDDANNMANQYQQQWTQQKAQVDQLKTALRHLSDQIDEAKRKKNLLIARHRRAEAQQSINSTLSSISDSGAFDSFARMEEKVDQIESHAAAESELNAELAGSPLDDKFRKLEASGGSANLNNRLEALKQKVNQQKQIGQ